jgi:ATP-dependent DNA helicase PIF1
MEEAALINKGAPWSDEQDAWLWGNAVSCSKEKMAEVMSRTPASIKSRLTHLAAKKLLSIDCDMTLQEVAAYTGIEEKWIAKRKCMQSELSAPYYAVVNGAEGNAIYRAWSDCQTNGVGRGSKYKKFATEEAALAYIAETSAAAAAAAVSAAPPQLVQGSIDEIASGLNCEQRAAFDAVVRGESILLGGSAGTGKSFTLQRIMKWANAIGRFAQQTAMTGTAALLVNGRTLHSFLGIGLAKGTADYLAQQAITKKQPLPRTLRRLGLLLIDEVSMLDANLCDKISEYLKILRKNSLPFGGVQIVFSGDFYQIPPVNGKFAFHSFAWKDLAPAKHFLKTLVRQADDEEFQGMLERLKKGVCNFDDFELLANCRGTTFDDGIEPTRLYSLNRDVDAINRGELSRLLTERPFMKTKTYMPMFDRCLPSQVGRAAKWAAASGIGEGVELAVGAQVVVTKNIEPTGEVTVTRLVNGSRGVVLELGEQSVFMMLRNGIKVEVPYVCVEDSPEDEDPEKSNGKSKLCVRMMPLKLAWALTTHKAQGMTLDAIEVDLGASVFEYGQAYTALSRARTLDSVKVVAVSPKAFKCHPDVLAFMS